MTKCTRVGIMGMVVAVALAGTACRQDPEVAVQKAMDQSRGLLEQGNVDGAVKVLQRVYDTKACAPFRPQLLGAIVNAHLAANRMDAAQSVFKAAAERNPAEAGAVIGTIEEPLLRAGRFEDLATWCASLKTLPLEAATVARVAEYHTKALVRSGKMADLAAVLKDYLKRLPEDVGLGLVERRFTDAMGARAFDHAQALVALVSGDPVSAARSGLEARLSVELLIARQRRAEALALFKRQARTVPDDSAASMLNRLVQAATAAGERQEVDTLCRFVLDTLKDRAAVRNTAAELWVGNVQGDREVAVIVERLARIRQDGCPPDVVVRQIDRHYGTLMAKGTKAEFLALLELCQALAPGLQAEDGARLSIIMLDLCFYLERFADALAIVEQKIPGRDSQWSRSLVSKIKAHLCLQQGKPREAVAHFREFMNAVAQDQADQIDPVSGTRVTKEMILGLNAKRIGDILAADGDKDGAAKAYQEARDAYTAALKGFSEGSSEYTKITNDRAAVPGGAGN